MGGVRTANDEGRREHNGTGNWKGQEAHPGRVRESNVLEQRVSPTEKKTAWYTTAVGVCVPTCSATTTSRKPKREVEGEKYQTLRRLQYRGMLRYATYETNAHRMVWGVSPHRTVNGVCEMR